MNEKHKAFAERFVDEMHCPSCGLKLVCQGSGTRKNSYHCQNLRECSVWKKCGYGIEIRATGGKISNYAIPFIWNDNYLVDLAGSKILDRTNFNVYRLDIAGRDRQITFDYAELPIGKAFNTELSKLIKRFERLALLA
jgi:hypothetical protein